MGVWLGLFFFTIKFWPEAINHTDNCYIRNGAVSVVSSNDDAKRTFVGDLKIQIVTLTRKNFLIQLRSTTAFMTQLFIGVIFLGLLRLMQYRCFGEG
jgi:hypothetical protein